VSRCERLIACSTPDCLFRWRFKLSTEPLFDFVRFRSCDHSRVKMRVVCNSSRGKRLPLACIRMCNEQPINEYLTVRAREILEIHTGYVVVFGAALHSSNVSENVDGNELGLGATLRTPLFGRCAVSVPYASGRCELNRAFSIRYLVCFRAGIFAANH
jgi:hypothetical protein